MLKNLVCLAVALTAVQAMGDLVVLHSPDSVTFTGHEEIEQSTLKDLFAAALGYTVKPRGPWSSMSITNPFRLPEAIVAIPLEGMESLDVPKGERFPLVVNEVEETTWQALRTCMEGRDKHNTFVRIYLADGVDALGQSSLGELKPVPGDDTKLKGLNMKKEEDKKFIEEVQLLHAIAEKVPTAIKPDSKPDIYWLVVSGLRPVFDAHGRNSTAAKEALFLLNNALTAISDAFIEAYDGRVIIAAFTNDASQVRRTRSVVLNRQTRDVDPTKLNLAKNYSENYPVVFNIMLWFGVAFFFSLLAICIAIADMDPGRDSIIYRMTSNRMKKDN